MLFNTRCVLFATVLSAIASAASLALADHDHGRGWSGGWGGGHDHVSFGHFDHGGFNSHFGFGGVRFYSGRGFYGWPYAYSYRPYVYSYWPYTYGFYGYPSVYSNYGYPSSYYGYPGGYYAMGDDNNYIVAQPSIGNGDANAPPRDYIVSRPVSNTARLEVRLPDPQATIWVEGKEIASSGAVRQFNSPPLEPSHQYTYTVKAEWHDNGKLLSDQRQVSVEPNGQFVVDFTQPPAATSTLGPTLPDLPPPQPRPAQ
jgi:uncharacterized protein (TIGR03000 family)